MRPKWAQGPLRPRIDAPPTKANQRDCDAGKADPNSGAHIVMKPLQIVANQMRCGSCAQSCGYGSKNERKRSFPYNGKRHDYSSNCEPTSEIAEL